MPIIKTLDQFDFDNEFERMGRGTQFTTEALTALYDFYNEHSDNVGEPWELDVIAVCCDWTEYDNMEDALRAYNLDDENDLYDHTTVIELSYGTVLLMNY